jgi:hypothetical protein
VEIHQEKAKDKKRRDEFSQLCEPFLDSQGAKWLTSTVFLLIFLAFNNISSFAPFMEKSLKLVDNSLCCTLESIHSMNFTVELVDKIKD